MRLASGAVAHYDVSLPDGDESVIALAASPTGTCLAVLSERHVHFWACGSDLAHVCSVPVPCASVVEDPATHILWHPRGDCVVLVTLLGRVVFCEVDIAVRPADVLAPSRYEHALRIAAAVPRVRFAAEEQIETGIVTALAEGGPDAFFACTNGGIVCVFGWLCRKLLRTWSCASLAREPHVIARADECAAGGDAFSGAIIDARHSAPLRLTALLLSTGSVVLARSGAENGFAGGGAALTGLCSAAASAVRVSINARHALLATATHTGEVVCERIAADLSLAAHWHGLRGRGRAGPVGALEWSPCGEALCVGLRGAGVCVLHCSGVCLFAPPLPAPACAALSWDAAAHRLFVAAADARAFAAVALERVAASPTATAARCAFVPVVAFSAAALRVSGASPAECLRDAVPLCARYAAENAPLLFAAVSADGAAVAVAGRRGFALLDCGARRWRTLCDRREEEALACVAQPLWLGGAAVVVPARVDGSRGFALRVYAHRRLDASALLAQAPLEHRPLLLACCHGDGRDALLLAVDAAHVLRVWRCAVAAPQGRVAVAVAPAHTLALPPPLRGAVALAAVHPARLRSRGPLPVALLVRRGSHALVALDLSAGAAPVTLCAGGAHSVWVDESAPLEGAAVIAAGAAGVALLRLSGALDAADCEAHAVAAFDADALPVGLCAPGGCLLALAAFVATARPVPYAHRILSARALESGRLLAWLERMRASGTFVANVECFLHTLINETPPDGGDAVEQREALQAALKLLRRYAEFHSVVLSCARKMEPSRQRVVLDLIGAPVDIFLECVEKGRLDDAAQLLHFVVLDSETGAGDAMARAMTCAVRLLTCAVSQLNVSLVDDLLRFVALLHAELAEQSVRGAADVSGGGASGLWRRVRSAIGLRPRRSPRLCLSVPPQRRASTEFLLRRHPGAAAAVRAAAAAALFAGHFVALRAVLRALSLPLPAFVAAALEGRGAAEGLAPVLDGLHDEHGLPLGARRVGAQLARLSSAAAAQTNTDAETERALWTTAQAALYATPGAAAALIALREDYAAWNAGVAVINLVLMRTADLAQQLRDEPALCRAMEELTLLPRNAAYQDFVRKCIGACQTPPREEESKAKS